MASSPPSAGFTPVNEMIASHTLASSIMSSHNHLSNENGILDNEEMSRLQRFVSNPEAEREPILRETGLGNVVWEQGGRFEGSLVGFIALRYGSAQGDVFTGEEMGGLGEWFGRGRRS
ncbi:hypothetical protein LTR62_005408 [Meristemomyces frigidus]|uniref:Uncharacterized protein n=1 Tax=Meristemomyces frigidus TaxID=1508187 RepID=A0AAN7TDF3_9PEZI|nr:hypothetical protein LTR62_005408 [Meristemomyces frigidus]